MNKTKSAATGKSSDVGQASAHSNVAVPRRQRNMQMVQNVLLIWLDNKIDDSSTDYGNTINQLRGAVNTIVTFMDGEECVEFVEDMDDNKACMLISGSLGEHIVPRVHDMSQVDSIFIFCGNKKRHEQWAKEWSKIRGVFTDISSICEALKETAHRCEQDAMPISFMATSGDVSKKNLDQLEPSFMYTQILKEILLTIKFEQKHITEFIDYCRDALADNESELENVKILEQKYRDETPIWWYTYECFLYPMLNRALRLMDIDIIIKMGFFIGDLHRHIERLHSEQFNGQHSDDIFTIYRGQGMSNADFKQLTKTKGGLISFNNFLSTSKDRDISLGFARCALPNPDMMGIIFVITIDPSQSTTPFASVTDVGYFGDQEDEILFAMHTVFRICDITNMSENPRLFQVGLTLTSDNDKDLRVLTDRIREETYPKAEGWYRLGLVLLQMGQPDKAEQVYGILLDQATKESEKAHIYNQLGRTKCDQGEYEEAITFYKKDLEISQKTLSPTHPDLAKSYSNIGAVYNNMNEYSKALSFYEKAYKIFEKTLSSDHPDLAAYYNNIGLLYYNMDVYSKALSSYEKAYKIFEKTLPPNHPDLGVSYNNMGLVYENMSNYSKARSFYERAMDIARQSLPPNHPDLQKWRKNLDRVKKKL